MATVTRSRRRRLHNPARRGKRLTDKQVQYFGTPRQKAALKRRRKTARTAKSSAVTQRRTARRRASPRRANPEIITFGLAGNPAKTTQKRRSTTMARTRKRARRRVRRVRRSSRRANPKTVVRYRTRRRRNLIANPRRVRRYRRRNARRRGGRRRNPALGRVGGLFTQALWLIGGAVGARGVTQLALGGKNTGILGYAGNLVTALLLGWGVGKFARSPVAGTAVTLGGMVGLTMRLIQDLTPIGKFVNLQLSGMDGGLGALLPSSYVDPALFTGQGAERYIPAGWRPAPPAQMRGLGASTYAASTYRA